MKKISPQFFYKWESGFQNPRDWLGKRQKMPNTNSTPNNNNLQKSGSKYPEQIPLQISESILKQIIQNENSNSENQTSNK